MWCLNLYLNLSFLSSRFGWISNRNTTSFLCQNSSTATIRSSASEANTVDPGRTTVLGGTAVTFTVLVPLLTLTSGNGFEFGFLKKKFATISPQLSEINSARSIVQTA